jgi:hypothetical protein
MRHVRSYTASSRLSTLPFVGHRCSSGITASCVLQCPSKRACHLSDAPCATQRCHANMHTYTCSLYLSIWPTPPSSLPFSEARSTRRCPVRPLVTCVLTLTPQLAYSPVSGGGYGSCTAGQDMVPAPRSCAHVYVNNSRPVCSVCCTLDSWSATCAYWRESADVRTYAYGSLSGINDYLNDRLKVNQQSTMLNESLAAVRRDVRELRRFVEGTTTDLDTPNPCTYIVRRHLLSVFFAHVGVRFRHYEDPMCTAIVPSSFTHPSVIRAAAIRKSWP